MNNNFIKLLTIFSFIAIIILQGLWLYSTYSFWEKDLKNKLNHTFSQAIEKEVYIRLKNKDRIPTGAPVPGASPDLSSEQNALYFQEFLASYEVYFIFERLDSILNEEFKREIGKLDYSLALLNEKEEILKQTESGIRNNLSSKFLNIEKPVRLDNTQIVRLTIISPYRVIFEHMLLLLIASFSVGLIIIYCIYLQIRIINRQDRIAEIRQDFTHAMIHDMKNPITTIIMGINALKSGKLDDKQQLKQQYYKIVTDEGENLLTLTDKILTIAKFEENRISLSKQTLELSSVFDKLTEKYKLNSEKDIKFITEYNNCVIIADEGYIFEAFNNLLDNAVKYSSGNKIRISITCINEISNTIIKIKDNGIGISLEDQKRIFHKFERVTSLKRGQVTGFGLGLNYVYQVVTAHEGNIKINSVLNSYCEFIISLPNGDNKTIIN